MRNDSIQKTFLVAAGVCLVCSILVSTAAVNLQPIQAANKLLDKRKNILVAGGLWEEGKNVDELFTLVETRVVNLATGDFVDDVDPETFVQTEAARDPKTSIKIADDIAGIKRRAKLASVYLVLDNNKIKKVILPVHGKGLWSTMYAFMALGSDFNTIEGFVFYQHGETPGLGGEVDNPKWKAQWLGKKVYGEDGSVKVQVLKGKVNPQSADSIYQADGLGGSTLTTRGITNLLKYWMDEQGFKPFLKMLRHQQGDIHGKS